jgi:hypothetical protein
MTPAWQIIFDDLIPFMSEHGMTPTEFCRRIGRQTSLTTITRPLNDPLWDMNPSIATINWIYEGMGKAVPDTLQRGHRARATGRDRQQDIATTEIRVLPAPVERVIRLEIRIPPTGDIVVHLLP